MLDATPTNQNPHCAFYLVTIAAKHNIHKIILFPIIRRKPNKLREIKLKDNLIKTKYKKHVIFVSDMEESMKGANRRDFTQKAPADKTEAEAWAKADLKVIQQLYKIQPDALAGTAVNIYLPKEAQQGGNFQTVLYYREAIFEALAISSPEVRGIEIGL